MQLCAYERGDKFVRLLDAKASNCEHIPIYGRIEKINTREMKLVMELIDRIGEIPEWSRYEPDIQHYSSFPTNITATAAKNTDVHRTFCTGRASFIYYDSDEFGQLVPKQDEISKLYFRSILMYNALSSYNICIDLSWQVVWLYLSDSGLDLIYDKKLYERYLNGCNLVTLNYQLSLAKEYKIRDFINTMFNDSLTQQVRRKYNFFKHKALSMCLGLE